MDRQYVVTLSVTPDTVSRLVPTWPAGVTARVLVSSSAVFRVALADSTPASITAPQFTANVLHNLGDTDPSKLYAASATASATVQVIVDLI